MSISTRTSIYEKLRPYLDAADLISRLGLNEVRSVGSESYCTPLCHESSSGASLQINLHTGRWNCKACQSLGIHGDLIQLVEYTLTRGQRPSHGSEQGGSATHREALVWLCEQFGIPFDEGRVSGDPGLDVVHLFSMAAHRHLLETPQVLEWILEKWGFDRATVESHAIGFMPSPILPMIASEAKNAGSRSAFRSSGLGWFQSDGSWHTRFAGRVLFPYLEHGRSVYLIGRSTPWTPKIDGADYLPKYYKLPVHSKERAHISERVTNDHLYNEPVMTSTTSVVIAEGVADAVALSSLGVPVVSPVTINFNKVDLERFTRKARESNLSRVEILFDNELSGSGNHAARRTGLQMVERGLVAKILTLPLGDKQKAARDEVVKALGQDLFDELERSDPRDRKALIVQAFPDRDMYAWIVSQVEASKIDAAEWMAECGAGAPGRFDAIRREGVDVVHLEISEVANTITDDDDASTRLQIFGNLCSLVAHVDDRLAREAYAGDIAKAAGKGVTKAHVVREIANYRRSVVKPKQKEEKRSEKLTNAEVQRDLILLPPETAHTQTQVPAAPVPTTAPAQPGAAPAPPPPGQKIQSDHERYAKSRIAVAKGVDAKFNEEALGEYIAQTILRSMGFVAFRTPDEIYLVRGSKRIPVGLDRETPAFLQLLYLASGLTPRKSSHRAYMAATRYFLERSSRRVRDVSWSYVGENGNVYFPTGDHAGSILKIGVGELSKTKMAESRVPAVSGDDFKPFEYTEEGGGIERALQCFRWTSINPDDRLVLTYWIACLPLLRRIGTVPIVRIEGGSSSGKTRTVDAVSYLVNGGKSGSVPTPAALVSRMSTEMLTVDDNREANDVNPQFLGTLLQATHLGAREKRKNNSDTGTIVERVCGALLMNGVEPIHDGKSELASRMLTLRCSEVYRVTDSPSSEGALVKAILSARSLFWSDAVRCCSRALATDVDHGDSLGVEIEQIFGATRIGRLSTYLRIMYQAWVAGRPAEAQPELLASLSVEWRTAFARIASGALSSLLAEELSVSVVRYVFAYGRSMAEPVFSGSDEHTALDGKYLRHTRTGEEYLGPVSAAQLARMARMAGKDLNAPRAITHDLRAGQLEARLIDGSAFLEAAGYGVTWDETQSGKHRYSFKWQGKETPQDPTEGGGETWTCP